MPPGLNSTGQSPDASTIVDSTPTSQFSPSMIASILPRISSITCTAFVGLGLPERFALGAAIGTPADLIRRCAVLFSGKRTATVSIPAVTVSGTILLFLSITVNGPGINASISAFAFSLISTVSLFISSISAICTMSGLSDGLPFAS